MRRILFASIFALGCGTLAAQPPAVRPALPPAKPIPQPLPLTKPQIRPLTVVTGTPVYRPGNFVQGPFVANTPWIDPSVANPNINNPWQMPILPPNWNPGLPAGWNPGLPAGWNANGPAGWANATPAPSDWSSPPMTLTPSLSSGVRANGAFGVNPLPVLFP